LSDILLSSADSNFEFHIARFPFAPVTQELAGAGFHLKLNGPESCWLWLPAFESFEGAPVLTGHLSDLPFRRQTKRACAAEARLRTRGSQARSLFTLESGSGFSC